MRIFQIASVCPSETLVLLCFAGDFCLALSKGHERRWQLGMARLLHGGMRQDAMDGGRRDLLSAWAILVFWPLDSGVNGD